MEPILYKESYPAGASPRISLKNLRGSIFIRGTSHTEIAINATLYPDSGENDHTTVHLYQEENQTVYAETRLKPGFKTATPCRVDYVVEVPETCDTKINSLSSSVIIENVQGQIEIDSVQGDLFLTNISGNLRLNSVSGDISGTHIQGNAHLKTVSGEIRFQESSFTQIKTRTVSGDTYYESPLEAGPYTFDSVSGDTNLVIPQSTNLEIEFKTLSGEVYIGLSSTYLERSRKIKRIVVQDGGTPVTFKSVSGNLTMVTPEQTKYPAPKQPNQMPSPKMGTNNLEILEKIERGELSVEQGLQKLNQAKLEG